MESLGSLLSTVEWGLAIGILFIAFLIRMVAGFGSGLIAIPLLALMLPINIVVPLVTALDSLVASTTGVQHRDAICWREIKWLALPVFCSTIVAYLIFLGTNNALLKGGLGVFVFLYGLYLLASATTQVINRKIKPIIWAMPTGIGGGFIGTLYGTSGPFYVMFLTLRCLDKRQFRATLSTIFLFEGINRLSIYWIGGTLNNQVLILVGMAIPIIALAMYLGEHIHTSISADHFSWAIAVLLIVSGLALVVG